MGLLKPMESPLRERAQGSTPESEAWVDAEHVRALSYHYWFAWLRHYEAVGDRSVCQHGEEEA